MRLVIWVLGLMFIRLASEQSGIEIDWENAEFLGHLGFLTVYAFVLDMWK